MQTQHRTGNNIHYDHVLAAWCEQVITAANGPDLKHRLMLQEGELLPRFATQYTKLSTLPRRARRAMQRQWKRSLAGVALLLALGHTPAMAATINVGAGCSLVNAITAANTDTAPRRCAKGSGADTIVLPAGSTQTLTAVNNTNTFGGYGGDNGLPVVASAITIEGNGAIIKRVGTAPEFRILAVDDGATLTLKRTKVTGGKVSDGAGGGVINGGSFILSRGTISGNSVSGDYNGGGVFNAGGSSVTITNSTVSGNTTDGSGGGIASGGALIVTKSTISANSASRDGGGILTRFDVSTISNSTISGNSASNGGGGVFGSENLVTIRNSTITRNSATGSGGGVGTFISDFTLSKTLISGNTSPLAREAQAGYMSTFTVNDFNVFGFNGNAGISGFRKGATDIVPRVGLAKVLNTTLANNGGRTRTHALPTGSPAIDSVSDGTCPPPARDQRGVRRPRDGDGDGGRACDTGSFER